MAQVSYRITEAMRAEYARAAQALYRRGANAEGHLLSALSATGDAVTAERYDHAGEVYRAWLVFNEPKAGA